MGERRRMVAVVGTSTPSDALYAEARTLGCLLVDAGFRVVSGGRGGVMEAVSRGAHDSARYHEGDVIAVLPGLDVGQANRWVDVALPTGLGHARNMVVANAGDVVVALGGGAGTLSELAMAWVHNKPVIALESGEGWSARIAGQRLDDRRDDVIERAVDAAHVVRLVHLALRAN